MKHQQISVDFISMVSTAWSYLALAGAVWIFLRLVQACFWLPRHLKRQNQVQRMLHDKVEDYEKYILECEEKEKREQELQGGDGEADPEQAEKWKERRECLEMLKRELNRVRNGVDDPRELEYLLKEEETKENGASITEVRDDEISKDGNVDKVSTKTANMAKQTVDPENKKDK